MGGEDDRIEWGAPSPSPRTFFTSLLGDDISSRQILESNNNMLFASENNIMEKNNDNDKTSGGYMRLDMYSQQKMNSRGGLLERMAARAGFNAPKLNTEDVRPSGISQNQDGRSTFLTIPPGLSPTTLLESPVFLSNALAQPSPTTGQFPFAFGGLNNRNFSLASDGHDKSQENLYEDTNTSSFAFKPIPESGHSSFLGPTNNNFPGFEVSRALVASTENSSPPNDQQDEEPLPGGAPAEDGYNWRKYGQKQVKGSEYPRSYYKCTHLNCPVKKKVERSYEGHITEIIYKGTHIHLKPSTNGRWVAGTIDTQGDVADRSGEVMSSASAGVENVWVENESRVESGEVADGASAVSNDDNEEEGDRATHGSASLSYEGEEDESESKRRKIEAYAADMSGATRAIREPRVVVQTTSEVDILDDGYRWRKYGQKVVKGNPNPRSYYKCTHAGCSVRKHVERASHDLKSVITTYEGKHNHEVPAARNTSHQTSANGTGRSQRPDPAQLHNDTDRFGRHQFGPGPGYSFAMGQSSLANLAMAGLGPDRSRPPFMAPYLGQQRGFDGMGFMLPKVEPKVEPLTDMHFPNGYYQMMSQLPLGP